MTDEPLMVLWRGDLTSCNYSCPYCPFAKAKDTRHTLAKDRRALERFVQWAASRAYRMEVLFTPWGEALIRPYYREAMMRLSHAPNISSVAIQTNLSCSLDWVDDCNLTSLAFWTTYHPGEIPREKFISKIGRLVDLGARYSVGMVGLRENFDEIEDMRRALPASAYLWINAYKDEPDYYQPDEVRRLERIDPLFRLNLKDWPSKDKACFGGERAISVSADGAVRRCHFLPEAIGNIYQPEFEARLRPRACPASLCNCHIGYSQLKDLEFRRLFGNGFVERRFDGVLETIPIL